MLLNVREIREKVFVDMVTNPESYAAIYARQSNKSDKVHSLKMQEFKGKETALKNNLLIYKHYSEKVSATEIPYMERDKFRELIDDAKAEYFKTLIVYKRDRLARSTEDFIKIKTLFKNLGIKIIYSNENEFHSDNSPTSDFIENIIAAVSELEPNTIRERTLSGNKKKREVYQEYSAGSTPAYGFITTLGPNKFNTATITHYIPGELKNFIRTLFNTYISNDNLITDNDLYNFLLKSKTEIPSGFKKAKIKDIITNPIYAARQTKRYGQRPEESFIKSEDGSFSHIDKSYFQEAFNVDEFIDAETWFTAANKWYHNHNPFTKHSRNTNYLFKGLLYCDKCGKKISLSNKNYSCGTAGCTRLKESYLNYEILNQIIKNSISNKNFNSELDLKIREWQNTITSENNKLIQLIKAQEKLIRNYLDKGDDEITKSKLENNIKEHEVINKNIKSINVNISYFEQMKSLSTSKYEKLNIYALIDIMITKYYLTRKYLLQNIEKVLVNGRNSTIIQYKKD